jgi:hypothetical protein
MNARDQIKAAARRSDRADGPYRASLTPRRRGPREMANLRRAIYEALEKDWPMSVRQLFYRLVVQQLIAKTENEYKHTVDRLARDMRLSGEVPMEWIVDYGRSVHTAGTWSSLAEALDALRGTYRRAVWDNQDVYIQIWLEKNALGGVFQDVTDELDVHLVVTGGFSSLSQVNEAAQEILRIGKPTITYWFGDHDPSGHGITTWEQSLLLQLTPGAEVHFKRVALNQEQVELWNLPTRPTKPSSHNKDFEGDSTELDALEPELLRDLVRQSVMPHRDEARYQQLLREEVRDKARLAKLVERFTRGNGG